ncbi:hypothetical protein ACHAXT_000242 [Thalassiosira profunda]
MASTMQMQQRRLGRREDGGGGGGCTATTILKLFWLLASALLVASITVTLHVTSSVGADAGASHREEQLSQRQGARAERRAQEPAVVDTAGWEGAWRWPTPASDRTDDAGEQKSDSASSSPSTDEEVLLKWLRERNNPTSPTAGLSQLLSDPVHFPPGALPLSQLSTLQQCYADPAIYGKHLKGGGTQRVPYSEKHQLAYLLLPKSGSSTGRFMMKHEFDAEERMMRVKAPTNVVTFVRDPLSRFFSQYDEAYARTAPWQKTQNPYYRNPDKPEADAEHPFPYLHENLHSYHDYEDVWCPPSTRNKRGDCIYRPTQENGTLASRLERFAMDYDGRSPFDIHLTLQVGLLSDAKDGRSIHITELYNTTDSEGSWSAIAKRYLGEAAVLEKAKENKRSDTKESGGVIQGRSFPRRFDKSLVGPKTERRICELALLDYCCLNFPLPSVCSGGGEDDKALLCKMDYKNERIRIQPGTFPERAK